MSEGSNITAHDRLLNAAEQVVAHAGVKNLTLEAVAHEAGVSKGGLLYHFPSKSALVTAIVERLATRCESEQNEVLEVDPHPGSFTRAYLAARSKPVAPEEELVHTAILAAAGTDPFFLEPFREKLKGWQARLENDDIDPAAAMIVRLAIDGYCLSRLLNLPVPDEGLWRNVLARLVCMTITGSDLSVRTEDPGPSRNDSRTDL